MKYKLGESKNFDGVTLYRVVAIEEFGSVRKGDIGGFVQSVNNLSQYGLAWVYDDARVTGDAQVGEDACVSQDACVSERAYLGGSACVSERAYVGGRAIVSERACVEGSAIVSADSNIGGRAYVGGQAYVGGYTRVDGGTHIGGRAYVTGDNIVTVSNIGSRNATLTATTDKSGQILLFAGCFSGTIDQFIAAVKKKHAGTVHERNYMAAIEFIKVRLSKME